MKFTYNAYRNLVDKLRENGYVISNYSNYKDYKKSVIMRHDVDNSLDKAVQLAKVENEMGISSTYFVLVATDFYNIFSKESSKKIKEIIRLGHEIGLHFDEQRYQLDDNILEKILDEKTVLEKITYPQKVKIVSMHRPSKKTLNSNYEIPGMINSYGEKYFCEFKYISDSRRRWRENVMEIIESGSYERLHILTHAFWYYDEEKNIKKTINDFLNEAREDRLLSLRDNITDLDSILEGEE